MPPAPVKNLAFRDASYSATMEPPGNKMLLQREKQLQYHDVSAPKQKRESRWGPRAGSFEDLNDRAAVNDWGDAAGKPSLGVRQGNYPRSERVNKPVSSAKFQTPL